MNSSRNTQKAQKRVEKKKKKTKQNADAEVFIPIQTLSKNYSFFGLLRILSYVLDFDLRWQIFLYYFS